MELRQLEYLVAVAEEANFTRAAERIHVAQPAVSAQIQRLERELGQTLVDRSRRAVRLTAAGEAVLPYARAALAAVRTMGVAAEELTQLVRGTVTIGTVTSHNVDIPQLLADFHAEHPNVEITLGTDTSDNLIESVRAGKLDLAIASVGPDEVPDGLDVEVVTDDAIHAAVLRTDPLAELAEHGLGVAIVPASVPLGRADLHALRFVPQLRGRLVLAWRSAGPISPAARVLIDRARRHCVS